MSERIELNVDELEDVVGGAIVWKPSGICYDRDNPDIQFHFNVDQFDEIMKYLMQNNGGGAHNLASLEMLRDAGYVW